MNRAVQWYGKAIDYLPCYVKARVHLTEIYFSCGQCGEAEALLRPIIGSSDPEVAWRFADVLNATGRFAEAEAQLQAALAGFEVLLGKHLLAFADHGAEFYAGSGGNPSHALGFVPWITRPRKPSRSAALLLFRRMSSLVILVQVEKTVHDPGLGEDVSRVTELTGLLIPSVIANYVD